MAQAEAGATMVRAEEADMRTKRVRTAKVRHVASATSTATHPRAVPTLPPSIEESQAPDQPFAEGAQDALGADLRHRLVSETAFHHYAERGFAEGYDADDWRDAEAEVDHLVLHPGPAEKVPPGGK